ncbi:MAG: hypothetical protein N2515_01985, partial [Deltaproteobacteria bacterium]|nr:hypothetical protein [Deltaproteobacteria bacterium]
PGNCRITVTQVEEDPEPNLWRRVHGSIRTPLFLNSTDPAAASPTPFEAARIRRNNDGRPVQNSETPFAEVPFVASIPKSVERMVREGGAPARLLVYGHGLFGSRGETHSEWFRRTIEELKMVGIAVDWWGMSENDLARVLRSLRDFSSFIATPERLQQGLLNFMVLTRSFIRYGQGRCELNSMTSIAQPFHVAPGGGGDPRLVFNPEERYYYGNSQGGIMGLSLAGLSVDIVRFVSGVGGIAYSTIISRSTNWGYFGNVLGISYPAYVDRAIMLVMSQTMWALAEPATYAPFIHTPTLPCTLDATTCPDGRTPHHHVLLMVGQDDAQVPTISADTAARTIGDVPVLLPAPYVPYGLPTTMGSNDTMKVRDAMAIFTFPGSRMLPPGTRDPMGDTPSHEGVRRAASALRMMDLFWREDGAVYHTCDGVCDPE